MNRAKGRPPGEPKEKVKRTPKPKVQRAAEDLTASNPQLQPWERENVCAWLAFTDSVVETARCCGLTPAVVQRVAIETPEYILQVRSAIPMVVRQRFSRTIITTQDKIAECVRVIPGVPTPEQADSIYTLCKCVQLQAEQYQLLNAQPESVIRGEGNAVDPRAQREADRRYLMSLMQDIGDRNPQLAVDIIKRAQQDAQTAEGENGGEDDPTG